MKQYWTSIKQVLVCYASNVQHLDIAENMYMYNQVEHVTDKFLTANTNDKTYL